MRYAATVTLIVAMTSVLAGCPREPDDTADDTGDDTADTDTGDSDTDTADTDTADTDTADTDTADTDTGTTPDHDLIISEVVSADMYDPVPTSFDRVPKYVEISNAGTTTENLALYTLAIWPVTNAGAIATELRQLGSMTGMLAPGESYVVEFETDTTDPAASGFFAAYGFLPDLLVDDVAGNGDDTFALYLGAASGDGSNATLIDVYGQIGIDGTGAAWEYDDTYGCRLFATAGPNATFTASEWSIGAKKLLEYQDAPNATGSDPKSTAAANPFELPLVLGYTSPGVWDAASCPPAGPECVIADDCDAPTNPCMEAVCSALGECGEAPAPGLLPDDVPGNCKQPSCDALGVLGTTNVDDPPADTFCTDNTCGVDGLGGAVVPVDRNLGLPLPTGQTPFDCVDVVCAASGATTTANVDDPLDDVEFCSDNICTSGGNDTAPRNVGTALPVVPLYAGDPAQVIGDCDDIVCDALGDPVPGTDNNADEPAQTACIDWTCTGGEPDDSNFVAPGTALPGNEQVANNCEELFCDAAHAVDERPDTGDKPADTDCTLYACVTQGVAPSVTQLGNETVLDDAVLENCHDTVCNGLGGTTDTTVVNQDDTPDDTACAYGTCNPDGTPGTPDPVAEAEPCMLGETGVCDGAGACVECVGDAQCGTDTCDLDLNVCTPGVVETTPAIDAVDVLVGTDIVITFSRPIETTSLTFQATPGVCSGSVQLSFDGFGSCAGFASVTWSEGDTVATLVTAADLVHEQFYDLLLTTDIESVSGALLSEDYTDLAFITESFSGTCVDGVVISEVYPGGGGASGSTYTHDFVELYNRGDAAVSLSGWSIQQTSATGTSWNKFDLGGSIAGHGYYLIQTAGASTTGSGDPLPTDDAPGTSGITMGAGSGKVMLVSSTTALTGACPTSASIIDKIGWGSTATCLEGVTTMPGAGDNSVSFQRRFSGCQDTDVNADDFVLGKVIGSPNNGSSTKATCSCAGDVLYNESGTGEVDYCGLITPLTVTVNRQSTATSALIEGKVYEAGVTPATTAPTSSIAGQVGYGPIGTDPRTQTGWVFFDAPFDSDLVNDDVYKVGLGAPVVSATTTFAYVYRFSLDAKVGWTYCDADGAGSNADLYFEPDVLGTMTVNP